MTHQKPFVATNKDQNQTESNAMVFYRDLDVIGAATFLAEIYTYWELEQLYGTNRSVFWYAINRGIVYPALRDVLGMWPDHLIRKRFACDIPPGLTPDQEQEFRRRMRTQAAYVAAMVRSNKEST